MVNQNFQRSEKMKIYSVTGVLVVLFSFSCGNINKTGSFHPGEVWKDKDSIPINAHGGGITFYNGKYWWFGEHKIEGEAGNLAMVGVHCYSSGDLYSWKDEGIALKVIKNQPGNDIEEGCVLERPKVIYNNKSGKFVMWFHLEAKGTNYTSAKSGVAISDHINGPYKYLYSLRSCPGSWPVNALFLKDRPIDPTVSGREYDGGSVNKHPDSLNLVKRDFEKGQMERDMTLFVDDDGKAYHIFSSEENSTLHIAELTDDFTNHSGKYARAFVGRFNEGPSIFKRNGKYYIITSYCNGWDPTDARSAVADSIMGPWEELGTPCRGRDSALTFHSQSTYILPVQGKKDAFIFMADRWSPKNAIDGRYVWLPVDFEEGKPVLKWLDKWDLSYFR